MNKNGGIRVVGFDPRWRADFATLNIEWLEHWFEVEPYDREVLENPERYILEVGGRIVVLAYQSLEDRIVKRELAERTTSTAPRGLPVELPEHAPTFRLLVKGAELAGDEERARNPRSIPVRLRAAERLRAA